MSRIKSAGEGFFLGAFLVGLVGFFVSAAFLSSVQARLTPAEYQLWWRTDGGPRWFTSLIGMALAGGVAGGFLGWRRARLQSTTHSTVADHKPTDWFTIGFVIYGVTIAATGLHMAWQGTLGLPAYLAIALLAGAVSGTLAARKNPWCGLIAGCLAGPCSLSAVYFIHVSQLQASNYSLGLAAMVGSLPGLGCYFALDMIRQAIANRPAVVNPR